MLPASGPPQDVVSTQQASHGSTLQFWDGLERWLLGLQVNLPNKFWLLNFMRWWFFCFLCRQDHWDGFCHFLDIRKKHTLLSYYTHYYWLLIYRQSVSSTNYWGWCVSWSVLSRNALLLRCPPPLHSAPSPRPPGPHPVCGGHTTATYTRCFTLTGSGWQESHQLQERRYDHSSWRSPAGLLLMGGYYSLTSTEILSATDSSSTPSFTLEYRTQWVHSH